jgi:hypothetical protein
MQGDILSVLRYGTDPVVKTLSVGAPDGFTSVVLAELESVGKDRRTVLDLLLGTAAQAN